MSHIVHCIADGISSEPEDQSFPIYEYIEKLSPSTDLQSHKMQAATDEKPFAWRMHAQTERKYQLFPKDKQALPPVMVGKGLDPEQAYAFAMGSVVSNTANTTANPSATAPGSSAANITANNAANNGLRLRIKEHTLIRRRKVSVPELGPMTTVQEVAMDSPTIPGRPPLHERSISAPGNSWKQHHLAECLIQQPAYDDIPEQGVYTTGEPGNVRSPIDVPRCSSAQAVLSPTATAATESQAKAPTPPPSATRTTIIDSHVGIRQPLSPKVLAPLVIPPPHSSSSPLSYSNSAHGHSASQSAASRHYGHQASSSFSGGASLLRPSASATTPLSAQSASSSRFRSGSTPIEQTSFSSSSGLRSARSEESPRIRTPYTPYTPISAVSTTSTLPTPISAAAPSATGDMYATNREKSPVGATPKTAAETSESRTNNIVTISSMPMTAAILGHRRGQSESGSIMERGRPRKRSASREGMSAAINAMVTAGMSTPEPKETQATTPVSAVPATPSTTSATVAATPTTVTTATSALTTPATMPATTSTPASVPAVSSALRRSSSKASRSAERRAFEMLPRGYRASDVAASTGASVGAASAGASVPAGFFGGPDVVASLAAQALQQAARFEVLRREDVDNLSRELRSLDERTEYLRRTYTSLRAGRRNLHTRICQYLRSPRVAKFSHDSMLRQEEALAELDTSIDDWVTKLEQAENRRTRVRQKLLEHVAAAATLPLAGVHLSVGSSGSSLASPAAPNNVVGVSESLQLAMGIKPAAATPASTHQPPPISTPPRSPVKTSFQQPSGATTMTSSATVSSPSASAAAAAMAYIISPVASSPLTPQQMLLPPQSQPQQPRSLTTQVPSTILEQPLVEEAMARLAAADRQQKIASAKSAKDRDAGNGGRRREDVESIRIYAGDDVYALLADVENQITQMGGGSGNGSGAVTATPATAAAAFDYFSIPHGAVLSDQEQKDLHRAHSQELLVGGSGSNSGNGSKRSSPSPPSSPHAQPTGTPAEGIFLTSAVFRPDRSMLAV